MKYLMYATYVLTSRVNNNINLDHMNECIQTHIRTYVHINIYTQVGLVYRY